LETVLAFFWLAVILYGISSLFYLSSFIHRKVHFIRRGVFFACLGLLSHTICISLYWTQPGYRSFSTFQIINDASWAGVFIFLLSCLIARFLTSAGILTMPLAVLLQIWAVISEKEIGKTPPAFDTPWFWIHVITSALAYGLVLVGGAIGLLYLLKTKHAGDAFYDQLPDLEKLDNYNYLFIGNGFLMLTLMIVSGALWTNNVYGSYWAWDPLEVQSLIAWIGYAIWLHMRLTFGWRGKKLAWYSIIALPLMVLLIFGIPLFPEMFHRGFRVVH
jgi:ABC-type transport system involved in cytochrome c biogenesis permease subunit